MHFVIGNRLRLGQLMVKGSEKVCSFETTIKNRLPLLQLMNTFSQGSFTEDGSII